MSRLDPEKLKQQLKDLQATIEDRKQYLQQIEGDIKLATENGAYALRDLQLDVDRLQSDKAKLMRENFDLAQTIQERKNFIN